MLYTVVRIGGGDYLLLAPASLISRFNLPVIDPPRTRMIFIYSLVDAHPALSRPALCVEVFFLKERSKRSIIFFLNKPRSVTAKPSDVILPS